MMCGGHDSELIGDDVNVRLYEFKEDVVGGNIVFEEKMKGERNEYNEIKIGDNICAKNEDNEFKVVSMTMDSKDGKMNVSNDNFDEKK